MQPWARLPLVTLLLISFGIECSCREFLLPTRTVVEQQFIEFFDMFRSRDGSRPKVAFINFERSRVISDVLHWALANVQYAYLITDHCDQVSFASLPKAKWNILQSTVVTVFLQHSTLDNSTVGALLRCPLFTARSMIFFLFSDEIDERSDVLRPLRDLWTNNILNFVAVFVHKKRWHLVTYNGFISDQVAKVDYKYKLFSNKLKDLHGHPLRVGLAIDFPRIIKTGHVWLGETYESLRLLVRMMNATLMVIETPRNDFRALYTKVKDGEIDFSFVNFFQTLEFDGLEFSNPRQLETLVVFVPRAVEKPKSQLFDRIVNGKTNIGIGLLTGTVVLLAKFILKVNGVQRNSDISYVYLQFYGTGFGYPGMPKFYREAFSMKSLLTAWLLASFIVASAFQTSLTSALSKPSSFGDVDTLQDLRDSQLRIYCPNTLREYFAKLNYSGFERQMSFVDLETMNQVHSRLSAHAYVDQGSRANILVRWGVRDYHVMKEPIGIGYNVHFYPKGSAYLDHIAHCLLKIREAGLDQQDRWIDGGVTLNQSGRGVDDLDIRGSGRLTAEHFKGVLGFVLPGYILSSLSFVLELVCAYVKRKLLVGKTKTVKFKWMD